MLKQGFAVLHDLHITVHVRRVHAVRDRARVQGEGGYLLTTWSTWLVIAADALLMFLATLAGSVGRPAMPVVPPDTTFGRMGLMGSAGTVGAGVAVRPGV